VTLVFSLRHAALPLLLTVAAAALALAGQTWAWVVVGAVVVAALLATRRIDLSPDTITFVPVLPLVRRQTIAWVDLGSFARSRRYSPRTAYDFVRATVTPPARFRLLWVYPTQTVTVAMTFAETPLGRALTADEFVALTESARGGQ
jgi:hypothetical protein